MSYTLVAKLKAKAGHEQELEQTLRSLVPKVRAGEEPDLQEYILNRSLDDARVFLFYEVYKDKAAFDFHMQTPYLKEYLPKITELLEGTFTVDTVTELDRK
jgi:quinol monooxygenase YgiN